MDRSSANQFPEAILVVMTAQQLRLALIRRYCIALHINFSLEKSQPRWCTFNVFSILVFRKPQSFANLNKCHLSPMLVRDDQIPVGFNPASRRESQRGMLRCKYKVV